MIILTNNIGLLLRTLDANAVSVNKPICVKAYRAANNHEIKDLQAVFYVDETTEEDAILREWDDIPTEENNYTTSDTTYNANEFLAGCKVWGIDLQDHYDTEEVVTVYLYREGL